jgi:NADPH2:quinone reductase
MRAVVIHRNGGPEVLELEERPEPSPGPGQLLVDVAVAGVNYRDVYEREGARGYEFPLPLVAGVEGAGMVRALGEGVDGFAAGDRVAWTAAPGSYAEQVAVDAAGAVPVPDGVSDELAAASLLQGMTAHYLCSSCYPVQQGDTVIVHAAAGGVGLLLTQMVNARGGRVIGTASSEDKRETARSNGADEVTGYEGFAERARSLTGGEGVAAVYDGVGATTFDEGLASLRPRGTMVLYGSASGPVQAVDLGRLSAGSLFLTRPVLRHHTATREELLDRAGAVFGGIADGTLRVAVGGRYPLADVRRAHEDLEGRRTSGKLVLLPGS